MIFGWWLRAQNNNNVMSWLNFKIPLYFGWGLWSSVLDLVILGSSICKINFLFRFHWKFWCYTYKSFYHQRFKGFFQQECAYGYQCWHLRFSFLQISTGEPRNEIKFHQLKLWSGKNLWSFLSKRIISISCSNFLKIFFGTPLGG